MDDFCGKVERMERHWKCFISFFSSSTYTHIHTSSIHTLIFAHGAGRSSMKWTWAAWTLTGIFTLLQDLWSTIFVSEWAPDNKGSPQHTAQSQAAQQDRVNTTHRTNHNPTHRNPSTITQAQIESHRDVCTLSPRRKYRDMTWRHSSCTATVYYCWPLRNFSGCEWPSFQEVCTEMYFLGFLEVQKYFTDKCTGPLTISEP